MNDFWQSPVYQVIKAMRATGNQPGVIAQWIERAGVWAQALDGPDAAAIRAWLPHWQPRPFYSAAELAPIFPVLIWMLGIAERAPRQMAPERLQFQLMYGGLPTLRKQDSTDRFLSPFGAPPALYFIVEQIHHWQNVILTQEEFNHVLHR